MQSIASLRASNGVANASVVTVQVLRSPGATTIQGNTVTGLPPFFIGTMGAPHTFTDPITGEVITVISDATAVDFAGHVSGGNLIIDAIAPGYVDTRGSLVGDIVVLKPNTFYADTLNNVLAQSHNDDGSFKADSIVSEVPFADPVDPVKRMSELMYDNVASGGVITGDGYGSTRNASMTALVAYINGQRSTLAAVAARVYTASKDTYVDILNTAGVFSLVYTEVANGVTAPALAANSIRLAKVITGATNIAAATSIVQYGQDGLGNVFKPDSAAPRVTHLRAYCTTGLSPAANGAVVPYDTKSWDSLNEWSTTNKKFTATKPGLYHVVARMWWGSAGAGTTESAEFSARLNGATTVMGSERNAGNGSASLLTRPVINDKIYLNAGDTLDFINGSTNNVRDIVASAIYTYVTIDRVG